MSERVNQSQRAYEQLRDEIVQWELPPGTHLNEVPLAERLSVSRTPLREAVQRLARDGLVTTIPGRGALVAQLALQDVVHLFQMREALEPYAARLCARNSDRREFGELRAAFDDQRGVFEKGSPPDGDYAEYYALIKRMDTAVSAFPSAPINRASGAIASRKPPLTNAIETPALRSAAIASLAPGPMTIPTPNMM